METPLAAATWAIVTRGDRGLDMARAYLCIVTQVSRAPSRAVVAVLALSAACFVSVTSEYVPVALLPDLAAEFEVSGSAIGLLVTGYAAVVAVTVVPLVALTARWDRRTTVLVTIAAVATSNVLLALAPSYPVAVVARVVSAVGHGVFWSVVAPVAARLLGAERAGLATALVMAGNSLAFLLGLPLTSWLGAAVGWRPTVLAVAAAAALSAAAVLAATGRLPAAPGAGRPDVAAVRSAVTDRSLLPVNLVTLTMVAGHFTAYTYVTVLVAEYAGIDGRGTSLLLLAHGAAGLLGLVLVGRVVDDRPRAAALAVTGGVAASMTLLAVAGPASHAAGGGLLVLWALPTGGLAVVLQAAVLRNAGPQPDLASAVYIVAFQVGIGLGALTGGVLLEAGALGAAVVAAAVVTSLGALLVGRSRAFGRAPARGDGHEPSVPSSGEAR